MLLYLEVIQKVLVFFFAFLSDLESRFPASIFCKVCFSERNGESFSQVVEQIIITPSWNTNSSLGKYPHFPLCNVFVANNTFKMYRPENKPGPTIVCLIIIYGCTGHTKITDHTTSEHSHRSRHSMKLLRCFFKLLLLPVL